MLASTCITVSDMLLLLLQQTKSSLRSTRQSANSWFNIQTKTHKHGHPLLLVLGQWAKQTLHHIGKNCESYMQPFRKRSLLLVVMPLLLVALAHKSPSSLYLRTPRSAASHTSHTVSNVSHPPMLLRLATAFGLGLHTNPTTQQALKRPLPSECQEAFHGSFNS